MIILRKRIDEINSNSEKLFNYFKDELKKKISKL